MFELPWLPPYDWQWMFGFLQARAVSGIERFDDGSYTRSWRCGEHYGLITMKPDTAHNQLGVTLSAGLLPVADRWGMARSSCVRRTTGSLSLP